MDSFEVFSDCSESSKNSECFPSTLSTLSGLSEYQEEFINLKNTINPTAPLNELTTGGHVSTKSSNAWYEQTKKFKVQMENSRKQDDKLQLDLYSFEKGKDIQCNEKIEKLLKKNYELEKKFFAANSQIERLIKNCAEITNTHTSHLQNKILELEKLNYDLTNQNYSLSNEINKINYRKHEIENDYSHLKTENSELKLKLNAQLHCVDELKKKIVEQHVEIQDMCQNNVKLTHSLSLMTSELEYVRKSENWYKGELQQLQTQKNDLNDKILQQEKNLMLQEERIQQLTLELSNWKCSYDEMHFAALKEKESILKQLEATSNQIVDNNCSNCNTNVNIERIANYYESVVNELTGDIAKIKSDFENQQKLLETRLKENSEILKKYVALQNYLKEKESIIKHLENVEKDLHTKLSLEVDKQNKQSLELFELSKNYAKLQIELNLKSKEKDSIENSVTTIKEQFGIFKNSYQDLKDELHKKNKKILFLQTQNQEIIFNYNQMVTGSKKYVEEIEQLKEKLTFMENIKDDLETQRRKYLEEIGVLNCRLLEQKSEDNETQINNLGDIVTAVGTKSDDPSSHAQRSKTTTNIAEILEYICKICKIGEGDIKQYYTPSGCNEESTQIEQLIKIIDSRFQFIAQEMSSKDNIINDVRKNISKLKKDVILRVTRLDERCKHLESSNTENGRILKLLLCKDNGKNRNQIEDYKRLQALLQVKIQEEKDKQNRYEENYRILLRKVKDHMRGRNLAEKQNSYLQELYHKLSDEGNTLKLELDCKKLEVSELQDRMSHYLNSNEKLKETTLRLEKELSILCMKLRDLANEESLKNCEQCKTKEQSLATLLTENQRLLKEILFYNANNEKCNEKRGMLLENDKELCVKLTEVEKSLTDEKSSNYFCGNELRERRNDCLKLTSERDQLYKRLENISEKNYYLTRELEHINSCLQRKCEEINELKLQKNEYENKWFEKEKNFQNLIARLKSQLYVFKGEIDGVKNEKFFLERLCNDLKIALKIHVDHNKALKEFINGSFKQKDKFYNVSSFSINFPSSTKYDDDYINKLLEANRIPVQDESFSDIQECLSTIRNKILFLQKQITEKNYYLYQ